MTHITGTSASIYGRDEAQNLEFRLVTCDDGTGDVIMSLILSPVEYNNIWKLKEETLMEIRVPSKEVTRFLRSLAYNLISLSNDEITTEELDNRGYYNYGLDREVSNEWKARRSRYAKFVTPAPAKADARAPNPKKTATKTERVKEPASKAQAKKQTGAGGAKKKKTAGGAPGTPKRDASGRFVKSSSGKGASVAKKMSTRGSTSKSKGVRR